jgi:hypothetical protein
MALPLALAGAMVGVYFLAPTEAYRHDPHPTQRDVAYFPNCSAARAAGAAPIARGEPGYRAPLDRDGDGVACEPYP